jgi:hypothetical protein
MINWLQEIGLISVKSIPEEQRPFALAIGMIIIIPGTIFIIWRLILALKDADRKDKRFKK